MKRCWLLLVTLILLLILHTQIFAEFKLVPMDPEFAKGENLPYAMRFSNFIPTPPSDKMKLEGVMNPKYGTLDIDKDNSVAFVAYSSDEKQIQPDTIIFDLNNDKNLTNDEKFTGFKSGEFKNISLNLSNGRKFDSKMLLMDWGIQVQPLEWYKGDITVDGKKISAVIIDGDGKGISLANRRDTLLLDLDGNGKFDVDIKTYDLKEMAMLQDMILLKGKLYSLKLDESKPDITVESYSGDQGKLAFELKFPKEIDKFHLSGYLSKDNNYNIISASQNDFPIALPAGDNNFMMVMLNVTDKSNQNFMIQFSFTKPVIIKKNETTTIPIGDFKPMEVIVNQKGNQLSVSKSLVDNIATEYKMIMSSPKEEDVAKGLRSVGPKVEIFDEKGNSLTKGEMQYG